MGVGSKGDTYAVVPGSSGPSKHQALLARRPTASDPLEPGTETRSDVVVMSVPASQRYLFRVSQADPPEASRTSGGRPSVTMMSPPSTKSNGIVAPAASEASTPG